MRRPSALCIAAAAVVLHTWAWSGASAIRSAGGERRAGDVALPLPAEPLLQESEEEIVDADFIRRWLRMLLRSPMEPWAVRMCMDLGANESSAFLDRLLRRTRLLAGFVGDPAMRRVVRAQCLAQPVVVEFLATTFAEDLPSEVDCLRICAGLPERGEATEATVEYVERDLRLSLPPETADKSLNSIQAFLEDTCVSIFPDMVDLCAREGSSAASSSVLGRDVETQDSFHQVSDVSLSSGDSRRAHSHSSPLPTGMWAPPPDEWPQLEYDSDYDAQNAGSSVSSGTPVHHPSRAAAARAEAEAGERDVLRVVGALGVAQAAKEEPAGLEESTEDAAKGDPRSGATSPSSWAPVEQPREPHSMLQRRGTSPAGG
mmetsp:Transcript_49638/g.139742  ORF Transcript_49638/g.139742 Transcript_49638/m.139742 type:complete len:373 (+) Transcript_49638:93-1211(+)